VIPEVRTDREDTVFYLNSGLCLTNKYPKFKNISVAQIDWIRTYLNDAESVLYNDAIYKDPTNGWRQYIDESSVIDWCLVNELAKNSDAQMYASVFFFKERNGKLKWGPLWDFDIAFGNIDYDNSECMHVNGLHFIYGKWLERFFSDDDFVQKYRQRYDEVKPVFDRIPEIIRKNADQLIASGAIDRHFRKWDCLGKYVQPNYAPYPQTYEGEVQRLTDWTRARNSWMNVNMFTSQAEACQKLQTEKIPVWAYDVDAFWAKQPTIIKTVRGYDGYSWNNGAETESYQQDITVGNTYSVKVRKGDCWSTVSDTIVYGTAAASVPETALTNAAITGYYNILGVKLNREPQSGIYIILYDDGKVRKMLK
jgi:hypothetical protein